MVRYRCFWVLVMAVLAVGCSSKEAGKGPAQQAPSANNAKAALQDVVKTGEVGSGLDDVRIYLEELKKTDAAKADPLLKEFNALTGTAGKPDQAKAKAKDLLSKL